MTTPTKSTPTAPSPPPLTPFTTPGGNTYPFGGPLPSLPLPGTARFAAAIEWVRARFRRSHAQVVAPPAVAPPDEQTVAVTSPAGATKRVKEWPLPDIPEICIRGASDLNDVVSFDHTKILRNIQSFDHEAWHKRKTKAVPMCLLNEELVSAGIEKRGESKTMSRQQEWQIKRKWTNIIKQLRENDWIHLEEACPYPHLVDVQWTLYSIQAL